MAGSKNIEHLDQCFMNIYEAARARVLHRQKQKALIVIDDDVLLLYRGGRAVEKFPGLRPHLYVKMKTLGHMPLAAYCLLYEDAGKLVPGETLAAIETYKSAIQSSAHDLDTIDEVARGLLPAPCSIVEKVTAMLDAAIANGRISTAELNAFTHGIRADIVPVLAAAARVQLEACESHIAHIRDELLTTEQWDELHVLVLGPYMARQGQNFLQYFSKLLETPMHGDRRLVYYEGEDLGAAFDRLGTTMLDAEASTAIFGDRERLHRDVLADATTQLLGTPPASVRKSA
jgi:hypothetical protein